MTRTHAAVCGLFLAVSISSAAPQTKADGPPGYLPTAVGATAVYETTAGKLTMETTDKVTGVEKTRDGFRVTVERTSKSGFRPGTEETDVSAQGVTMVRRAGREVDPPMPLLKLPAKVGDHWEWENKKADGLPQKVKFQVMGEEEVQVPAGKFKAIRVEQEEVQRGTTTRIEVWYAPKVGLVKRVFHRESFDQVQVLTSFTPGKE